ncbi:hypothetical protein C1646_750693 [Rhizophagus diaphanus]|nr:hypothetical protein C1646_750693 [Rhizophagus diaphanus] [Rhizophagus sp. MUCL 43196]
MRFMPSLFNKLRTISHKYLLLFLLNTFFNYNLSLCVTDITSINHSSKTSNCIDTIFSVDTKIGVSTKLFLVKETDINTGSVISKATYSNNPVRSKNVEGLGTGTMIGIIAASITVGIALLFLCGNKADNKNIKNNSKV